MANPTPLHPNKRDKEQVRVLAGMGATPEFIAEELNLSIKSLNQYYTSDLEQGPAEANVRVARTFFELATSGEYPQMTLAWMKMRAAWSDSPTSLNNNDDEQEESDLNEARDRLTSALTRRPEVLQALVSNIK